ncbi:hypothetical protein CBR_g75 [Chara braunii]|uniref:DNA topoisomerase n=1 Tax=Chara braunii TaxID=69332 RepID=A0A388JLI3_CHABU|nr:hypothetical protein CBR_g75 [Chara braunii]|eukprot:GBG58674.1 hypothetical protein CBR_g75 [Chara braunii]
MCFMLAFVPPPLLLQDKHQLMLTLQQEASQCQWLVLWLDCDREGENIAFEVIDVCRGTNPRLNVLRAHFSALVERDIHHAAQNLQQPNQRFADAVDARQEIDLRIGASFTRFQTLLLRDRFVMPLGESERAGVISYGPCQECHVSSSATTVAVPRQQQYQRPQCPATRTGSSLGMTGQLAGSSIYEYHQRFLAQLALVEADVQRQAAAEAAHLQAEAEAAAEKQRLQAEAEADAQALRREAQELLQRHEATSIDKLKFWHFEPTAGHDNATPEEQHKEFFSKLVARLVYTCNHQQSELEKQHQELAKQHQELVNLRRAMQSHKDLHEDATRALHSHVQDLEQAAPRPDAGDFAAIYRRDSTSWSKLEELDPLTFADFQWMPLPPSARLPKPHCNVLKAQLRDYLHTAVPAPLMDVEVVDLHDYIAKIDREFKTQRYVDIDAPLLYIRIQIGEATCRALIDYGATRNYISQDFMIRADLGPRIRRKSQPTQVTLAESQTHKSIDRCIDSVPVYFAPHASEAVSFDILDTQFDMILGMSWLRSEDHPVNFYRRTVHVCDRNAVLVPCTVAPPHPPISCHVVSAASIRASITRDGIEEMGVCFLHALPPHDILSMDSSLDPRIIELLDAYGDVFEAPHGVVPDQPILHEISLEEVVVPPRGCIYPMSEEELSVLRAQLDDVLEKGMIRPSSSPYGAPVLFVRKKNKDLWLCIDYPKLNVQTVKNVGPLPRIDDLLERRSLDEHVEHMRTVLERLRQAKYKANHDKCEFARQELEYLGHYVTPQGIRPLADKIEAIPLLEQHNGDDWHPVEYFGHKVPPINSLDDARKKGLLAFVMALKRWRHFLLERRRFTWVTDNNPLTYYKTHDTVSSTIGRWMYFIDQFDFKPKHLAGLSNRTADALSRRPDLCAMTHHAFAFDKELQRHFIGAMSPIRISPCCMRSYLRITHRPATIASSKGTCSSTREARTYCVSHETVVFGLAFSASTMTRDSLAISESIALLHDFDNDFDGPTSLPMSLGIVTLAKFADEASPATAIPTTSCARCLSHGNPTSPLPWTSPFPTLGFVVERYWQILAHVEESFWTIYCRYVSEDNVSAEFQWERGRLFDHMAAAVIYEMCQENPLATVCEVTGREKRKFPPFPLNTVELQKRASKWLRMGSEHVMKVRIFLTQSQS